MSESSTSVWKLLAVAGLLCASVTAQINTGRILGTVRDASGAVIPDARLTATNDATGAMTQTQSTESGDYVLNFLLPGTYHVAVEKQGFQRSVVADVVVNAGGITHHAFGRQSGAGPGAAGR